MYTSPKAKMTIHGAGRFELGMESGRTLKITDEKNGSHDSENLRQRDYGTGLAGFRGLILFPRQRATG
jgi:hypothetical protein